MSTVEQCTPVIDRNNHIVVTYTNRFDHVATYVLTTSCIRGALSYPYFNFFKGNIIHVFSYYKLLRTEMKVKFVHFTQSSEHQKRLPHINPGHFGAMFCKNSQL